MNRQQAIRNINIAARRYNLDPKAMMGIAYNESGLNPFAVGDNGTSYGLFQLHVGGALPQGRGAAWADSMQGIMYAARQMAASGAAGKRGLAAITAMSRNFERPANPQAEISKAWNYYQGHPGGGAVGGRTGGFAGASTRLSGLNGPALLQNPLYQANQQFATTGKIDPLLQKSVMQNGLTGADMAGNPRAAKGSSLMADGSVVSKIIRAAMSQKGVPYQWGGEKAGSGFDCSGLIQYAYAKAGISLPRTTYDQINHGKKVGWGNFKPGDLIFSNFEGAGAGASHVVMYIGNGKVIAAPHTGASVGVEDVNVFKPYFVGARRIVN